jgi:aspartyl protease family protein
MATGRIDGSSYEKAAADCRALCLLASLAFLGPFQGSAQAAESIGLAGVMGDKALVTIDGAPPRLMRVGQEAQGVKLISVAGQGAVVEADGERLSLRIGQNATGSASHKAPSVQLQADANGHFLTEGRINGAIAQFLVDTGATYVSMGKAQARDLGIDLSHAKQALMQTANGQAKVWLVKLDSVQVGGLSLHNVDCAVLEKPMPQVLLGMSFLNQTNMRREGDVLTLTKRF